MLSSSEVGVVLAGAVLLCLYAAVVPPFAQPQSYHDFADQREALGVPNFNDVASNLPFLLIGLLGLRALHSGAACVRERWELRGWQLFFAGIVGVFVGSSYYHWRPCNQTLTWDRLPIAISFEALTALLLGERVSSRCGKLVLVPAVLSAVAAVAHWHIVDDLRFYALTQAVPLIGLGPLLMRTRASYSHGNAYLWAMAWYGAAKLTEATDKLTFGLTFGLVSGHTLKHLCAAVPPYLMIDMLTKRKSLPDVHVLRGGKSLQASF